MPASNETSLRNLCARIIGWDDEHAGAVEHAVRSLELAEAPEQEIAAP